MPRVIDRAEVVALVTRAEATLVEVLPRADYEWAHLPDAVSIPLRGMDPGAVANLPGNRPVVVYCHDLQCDLSARAAWTFEWLGLRDVRDYAASKMDWLSFGLASEGTAQFVRDAMRTDVATFAVDDEVQDVRKRLAPESGLCAVVNEHGVLLGALDPERVVGHGDDVRIADVMDLGVPTVRPSEEVGPLVERMERASRPSILVTGSDGTFLGRYDRR